MYNVSGTFKTAIKSPNRELRTKATCGALNLTSSDILSIKFSEAVNLNEEFAIGTATSSSIEMSINNVGDIYTADEFENKEITPYIGVTLPDATTEYVPLGIFLIEEALNDRNVINMKGFDRMIKFEKPYATSLTYPNTLLRIAQEICSLTGITLATTTFANADYVVTLKPELTGVTCRKAIAWVAELAGGFARISRDGKLEIVTLTATDQVMTKDNYYKLSKKDNPETIDKVIVKTGEEQASAGTGTNVYYVSNNLFAQTPSTAVQGIYNVLNGLNFYPLETEWQGNPALQAGDKFTIDGLTSIVASQTITFKGGMKGKIKATGVSRTAKEYKGEHSLQIIKDQIKAEILIKNDEIVSRVSKTETDVKTAQDTADSAKSIAYSKASQADIDNALKDYVDLTTYGTDISELQNQIDGSIMTWFYNGVPTLSNYPANDWNTSELKNQHLGDLYYDNTTGYAYRFKLDGIVYSWIKITDTDVTKALQDAQKAQDTADGKRRVFVAQPITPYDIGDLWSQGSSGDLMKCKVARASGSYVAGDWENASKYTDDTAVNNLVSDLSNDNKLTPDEKQSLSRIWEGIKKEYTALANESNNTEYQASTERTNYVNAYTALSTTLTTPLSNLTTTSTIDGIALRTQFATYYETKQKLQNKMSNVSITRIKNAELKITSDAIVSTVTSSAKYTGDLASKATQDDVANAVNNLEIGGRNLVRDSSIEKSIDTPSIVDYDLIKKTFIGLIGEQITISFDAKALVDNIHVIDAYFRDSVNGGVINMSASFNITGEYKRCAYTINLTDFQSLIPNNMQIRFRGNTNVSGGSSNANGFSIKNVKIEKGSKATDWTPAPEDVDASIDNVQGNLDEVNKDLGGKISDAKSAITQNATAISSKVSQTDFDTQKGIVSKHTTALEQLDKSFTATVESVKELQGESQKVSTYMHFDLAGLTIGKSDSKSQVFIDNTSLQFIDSGTDNDDTDDLVLQPNAAAYIHKQKMFIKDLEATNSMIVGRHQIEKYSDTITLVKYIG